MDNFPEFDAISADDGFKHRMFAYDAQGVPNE